MEILKPLIYICPECKKGFDFAFQSSLNTFKRLHALQHELDSLGKWQRSGTEQSIEWTPFDLDFLKSCGVKA